MTEAASEKRGLRKPSAAKLAAEHERLHQLMQMEAELHAAGIPYVFGIDEAGRGPLCGPVVAGCCILPEDCEILFLNDSKKLSEARREAVFDEILETALATGVGMSSPARIDEINILNATYEAMYEAAMNCTTQLALRLGSRPAAEKTMFLIDGNRSVPQLHAPQQTIVKGDARAAAIAAASILAKVTRDRMLLDYDARWPEYGFAKHKGYGTKQHIEAIKTYGVLPIHRKSFLKFLTPEEWAKMPQQGA